jgi:hypothetical protein
MIRSPHAVAAVCGLAKCFQLERVTVSVLLTGAPPNRDVSCDDQWMDSLQKSKSGFDGR